MPIIDIASELCRLAHLAEVSGEKRTADLLERSYLGVLAIIDKDVGQINKNNKNNIRLE